MNNWLTVRKGKFAFVSATVSATPIREVLRIEFGQAQGKSKKGGGDE